MKTDHASSSEKVNSSTPLERFKSFNNQKSYSSGFWKLGKTELLNFLQIPRLFQFKYLDTEIYYTLYLTSQFQFQQIDKASGKTTRKKPWLIINQSELANLFEISREALNRSLKRIEKYGLWSLEGKRTEEKRCTAVNLDNTEEVLRLAEAYCASKSKAQKKQSVSKDLKRSTQELSSVTPESQCSDQMITSQNHESKDVKTNETAFEAQEELPRLDQTFEANETQKKKESCDQTVTSLCAYDHKLVIKQSLACDRMITSSIQESKDVKTKEPLIEPPIDPLIENLIEPPHRKKIFSKIEASKELNLLAQLNPWSIKNRAHSEGGLSKSQKRTEEEDSVGGLKNINAILEKAKFNQWEKKSAQGEHMAEEKKIQDLPLGWDHPETIRLRSELNEKLKERAYVYKQTFLWLKDFLEEKEPNKLLILQWCLWYLDTKTWEGTAIKVHPKFLQYKCDQLMKGEIIWKDFLSAQDASNPSKAKSVAQCLIEAEMKRLEDLREREALLKDPDHKLIGPWTEYIVAHGGPCNNPISLEDYKKMVHPDL